MSKYDFIKQGNLLYWHTADNDVECRIISTPEKVDSDSIILIATGSSEIEVLASELSPIGSSRSHKEEFLRWKKEREAEGMEFFNRLSEVMETDNDLAVGDMVAFTNDYGVVFGPKEVLASESLGMAVDAYISTVMPMVPRPSRTTHHTQQRRYRMTNEDKILKRLCGNIAAGRFNWRKYCTPQLYFGWEICVTPLHALTDR